MQKQALVHIHKWLDALIFAVICVVTLACIGLPAAAQAQSPSASGVQAVPALTARVIDQSGTLSSAQQQSLSAQLQQLEAETGTQIVVLMVPTTAPEDIASYSWRVAHEWKLGRKDIGDGLLIVVAKNDRRMRIEVARKLEGAIPDIMAARIIDGAMKPRFKSEDYAGGIAAAIEQLSLLIHGEKLPAPTGPSSEPGWEEYSGFLLPLLFFGFPIGGAIARSLLGRGLGSVALGGVAGVLTYVVTASLLIAAGAALFGCVFSLLANTAGRGGRGGRGGGPYISTGGWGSGGGWSSGGGGGFSSGGGGSFGGGGASGDW